MFNSAMARQPQSGPDLAGGRSGRSAWTRPAWPYHALWFARMPGGAGSDRRRWAPADRICRSRPTARRRISDGSDPRREAAVGLRYDIDNGRLVCRFLSQAPPARPRSIGSPGATISRPTFSRWPATPSASALMAQTSDRRTARSSRYMNCRLPTVPSIGRLLDPPRKSASLC